MNNKRANNNVARESTNTVFPAKRFASFLNDAIQLGKESWRFDRSSGKPKPRRLFVDRGEERRRGIEIGRISFPLARVSYPGMGYFRDTCVFVI